MMKTFFTLTLVLLFTNIFSQTFYWSNTPFEFCKEPTQSVPNKVFSDTSHFYGLCVIKNVDADDMNWKYKYEVAGIRSTGIDFRLTVKGTDYSKKLCKLTIWEKDKVLFIYLSPNPKIGDEGYLDGSDWVNLYKSLKKGDNTVIIEPDPAYKSHLKFKETITIIATKTYDENEIKNKKEYYRNIESETDFGNRLHKLDKEEEDRNAELDLDKYLKNRKEYNFPDEELSKSNIEKLLANFIEDPMLKLKYVYASDISKDWHVWKYPKTGEIESKRSPLLLLVFESPKKGWCYYGAFYVVKSYEGGSSYGKAFIKQDDINWVTSSYKRIGCSQIK